MAESSPSQRSRSGSRSRSRTGLQTVVDFCPEEQLIVELSHSPEGSIGYGTPGGSNISISVKALDGSQATTIHNHRQYKPGKDESSSSTHSPEQSGGTVLCASPMRWMSPKRSRKYISSNQERSLPQPPQDAKQETVLESHKHKKGSPGSEQKQRSFLKSPFSRRKRSGSSSSNSGSAKEQSPKQKPKEQLQPSPIGKQLEGQHFFPPQTQGSIYQGHQPQVRSQGRIHPDNIEIGSRVPVVGTADTVHQHSNLLYRKGSTSSSSSSSIQSPRDPRLLEAARFGAKREKSPSPSPGSGPSGSQGAGGTTPTTTQQKVLVRNGNGHVGTSIPSSTAAGGGKANSRIPSYYTNPKRRSLNLSDGPDICSDSSSEGGRTRRTRSEAKKSNGTPRSSVSRTRADSRTSSTESLRKHSSSDSLKKHSDQGGGSSSTQPRKTRQPSKLSLEGGSKSPRSSDSETRSQTRGGSQVPRSASGSRLPVNYRSSITSPPRSPRSPGSSSPRSTTASSEIQKKRRSDGGRASRTSTSGDDTQSKVNSSTNRRLSRSSSKESQKTVIQKSSREKESRGQDLDKRDSLSALSVGSDTSTTSVESRTLREPSEKRTTKIPVSIDMQCSLFDVESYNMIKVPS